MNGSKLKRWLRLKLAKTLVFIIKRYFSDGINYFHGINDDDINSWTWCFSWTEDFEKGISDKPFPEKCK